MPRLGAAYRAARYRGQPAGAAFLLTAWNPGSRRLPPAQNRRRQASLHAELARRRLATRPGWACAVDGSWREPGCWLPHHHHRSLELLRRFGQAAGLLVRRNGRFLLWRVGRMERIIW